MAYQVVWLPSAKKELQDLPAHIIKRIATKVEHYLALNPRQLGKEMLGGYGGLYRYRVGDYRVIYDIKDKEITIYIIQIGHRKNIYD